jgi:hypothetical protein
VPDEATAIRAGSVHAFYLFDVAQAIDVGGLSRRLGPRARMARLDDKAAGPPPIAYVTPPVLCDGEVFGVPELDGFAVRVKFYDYGVISLLLSRPFDGRWSDLVALGQTLIESEPHERHATDACARIVDAVAAELSGRRRAFLSEDYLVFAVTAHEPALSADEVIAQHGTEIAQLLRGERQLLSLGEKDEVLRHRLSYLADDLVVPAWNAAFIADNEAGALATMEVLEFANSQLLEFRYHDDLLDAELARIYADLQRPRWSRRLVGRRYRRAAREVQTLIIDVNELTDRVENAVKFVGDIYSARLFNNLAGRLGLDRWKGNVAEKLKTLDDINRFSVEQSGIWQANSLELAIAVICFVELWLLVESLAK